MSGSHEKLPWLFWVQLALAAIIGIMFLLAPSSEKHGEGAEHAVSETSKQALKPIGKVAVNSASGGSAAGGSGRTGKEIVEKTCQTCHANGVANAPKLDESGKEAWQQSYDNGLDSMMEVAKKGKGAMPPMGTDPTLTDAELKASIVYMLEKAGVEVAEASEPAAPAEAATEPKAEKEAKVEEASAPSAPEAPAAPEPPVVETSIESAAPVMEEATAAAPASPEPPVAEAVVAAAATTSATATEAPATASKEKVAEKKSIDGAKIYNNACMSCHAAGVAGSPKLGDNAVWEARIATGIDVLYESAIAGKGVMPPKGGNMLLSDDEVKAAVDYMIDQSK